MPTPSFIGGHRRHEHQLITRIWYHSYAAFQLEWFRPSSALNLFHEETVC